MNMAASTVSETWIANHTTSIWVVTGVFAALAVWQVLSERASDGEEGSSADGHLLMALAGAIEAERQNFLDQALGARYQTAPALVSFTNPRPGDLPTGAEALLVHWQALDGQKEGDPETITDFYQDLKQHRLTILGRPGGGKTVLLTRIVLDLIAQLRGAATPPPARKTRNLCRQQLPGLCRCCLV
jgi:hypothetical protein